MPFLIKAVSQALLKFPILNALLNEDNESLDIKKEHNISLAMDTADGLIVPNIKNVQKLNIIDITKEINRLQELGKKSLLTSTDLIGGTFSISNIGIVSKNIY
jgi:2-oxoisovalerate dehydrogenase E2 component (dihydrolipoyl transacylase)